MTDARAEWLERRRQGIGASDVSAILGISPWGSPISVYMDKVGITPPSESSKRMRLGTRLEPVINAEFHDETGLYVVGEQTWVTHPDHPWAFANLDGLVVEGPDAEPTEALGNLETKLTSDGRRRWDEDGLPAQYAAQVQAQMWVTGAPRTWVVALHASFGLDVAVHGPIERDEEDIAVIAERCERFWHDHVLPRVPPPADGHPATTEALRFLSANIGDAVDVDDETAALVERVATTKASMKVLKLQRDADENRLRLALGTGTEAYHGGRQVYSWRPQISRKIDPEAVRTRHPEIVGDVTKESVSRVLRLTNTKDED